MRALEGFCFRFLFDGIFNFFYHLSLEKQFLYFSFNSMAVYDDTLYSDTRKKRTIYSFQTRYGLGCTLFFHLLHALYFSRPHDASRFIRRRLPHIGTLLKSKKKKQNKNQKKITVRRVRENGADDRKDVHICIRHQ